MKIKWTKSKRWLLIISLLLLMIISGLLIAERWINSTIREKIHSAIPGERIDYDSVYTHLFSSEIIIKGFLAKIHSDNHNEKEFHNIYFKTIRLEGIRFLKILFNKELFIREIYLDSAKIVINGKLFSDTAATFHHLTEGNSGFKKIEVSHIVMNTASVLKGLYKYHLTNFVINKNSLTINAFIDSFKMIPRYSKIEFNKIRKFQSDRIDASVSGIQFKNINFNSLLKHELNGDEINIRNAKVLVYRDRRLPRKELPQPLPAIMLKNIPVPIRLNAFKIGNSDVEYEEYPKEGTETGTLKVRHLQLSLSPVINRPQKTDPSQLIMHVKGSLMGSGTVTTRMSLPLRSNEYEVKGSIQNLDLTTLNNSSENLGRIYIKSGLLDSLGFQFAFNDKKSEGKIVGIYHQLVIEPLNKKNKVQGFKSFMLRHLIIPLNKDRSLAERKRTGKIDYTRDPSRKVSFYLLQSLLTGIKSSFSLGFLLPK